MCEIIKLFAIVCMDLHAHRPLPHPPGLCTSSKVNGPLLPGFCLISWSPSTYDAKHSGAAVMSRIFPCDPISGCFMSAQRQVQVWACMQHGLLPRTPGPGQSRRLFTEYIQAPMQLRDAWSNRMSSTICCGQLSQADMPACYHQCIAMLGKQPSSMLLKVGSSAVDKLQVHLSGHTQT